MVTGPGMPISFYKEFFARFGSIWGGQVVVDLSLKVQNWRNGIVMSNINSANFKLFALLMVSYCSVMCAEGFVPRIAAMRAI